MSQGVFWVTIWLFSKKKNEFHRNFTRRKVRPKELSPNIFKFLFIPSVEKHRQGQQRVTSFETETVYTRDNDRNRENFVKNFRDFEERRRRLIFQDLQVRLRNKRHDFEKNRDFLLQILPKTESLSFFHIIPKFEFVPASFPFFLGVERSTTT